MWNGGHIASLGSESATDEVLEQLERLVDSAHFRNSKRYPALLRFLVQETLAGRAGILKERTLGMEVFGRAPDYDTNADPVVRISAGEVRKRIAQYYQSPGHDGELRIDLPLGSYVPQFGPALPSQATPAYASPVPAAPPETLPEPIQLPDSPPVTKTHLRARQVVTGFALLLATVAAIWLVVAHRHRREEAQDMSFFWDPVLQAGEPPLIVLGVSPSSESETYGGSVDSLYGRPDQDSAQPPSSRSDVVPLTDVLSYGRVVNLLTQKGRRYRTLGAMDTTFQELQQGPVVLLGGFNNIWSRRLTARLRYRFNIDGLTVRQIVDSQQPGTVWQRDISPDASSYRDFGIVACFFDPRVERYILLAGGIGRHGTAAASEFLTDSKDLRLWAEKQHLDQRRNVEIVLSTEVIGGEHGPPHVVASVTW